MLSSLPSLRLHIHLHNPSSMLFHILVGGTVWIVGWGHHSVLECSCQGCAGEGPLGGAVEVPQVFPQHGTAASWPRWQLLPAGFV